MTYEFVPQFSRMLTNLLGVLDKAQAYADQKKFDVSVLLNTRLAPDQFNFTRQIQLTCDTAKNFAYKLAGKEPLKQEDTETTVPQLQNRIRQTIELISSIRPDDFNGWKERKITNPRREGKFLSGEDFAMHQAIPNFYFHFTTAYSILRSNGVDVGKKDYLGELNYQNL